MPASPQVRAADTRLPAFVSAPAASRCIHHCRKLQAVGSDLLISTICSIRLRCGPLQAGVRCAAVLFFPFIKCPPHQKRHFPENPPEITPTICNLFRIRLRLPKTLKLTNILSSLSLSLSLSLSRSFPLSVHTLIKYCTSTLQTLKSRP